MKMKVASAYWALSALPSERLPEIAVDALEDGNDSLALRQLAGDDQGDYEANRELFKKSLLELGLEIPPVNEATRIVAQEEARRMVSGEKTPYQAATLIQQYAGIYGTGLPTLGQIDKVVYKLEECSDDQERVILTQQLFGLIKHLAEK